jgi:hypothetical protein
MYSPPLSSCKLLIFSSSKFSAQALNVLNAYKQDSRLFQSCGTFRALVNSTALDHFPLMTGLESTVPTPAEYMTVLSANLMGMRSGV